MFINGQWISAKKNTEFPVFNPANGKQIASVPDGGKIEAEVAVSAAYEAFQPWSSQTAYQRSAFLYAAHGLMMEEDNLDKGHFYFPTILDNVTDDMLIYREETFGPVAPVITYEDEDTLLNMANDTDYGLAAYVYTQNLSKAMMLFEGLKFGIIGINDINPTAAAAPFGGIKESGIGREGSLEGIEEYLETKLGGFSLR